jgi:hypothetical protein
MENYNWETETSHSNNTETMNDYLENHLLNEFHIVIQDDSYAEIQSAHTANIYAVHASGNGDFTHHSVRFELLS